jgi:hypothetical protein
MNFFARLDADRLDGNASNLFRDCAMISKRCGVRFNIALLR